MGEFKTQTPFPCECHPPGSSPEDPQWFINVPLNWGHPELIPNASGVPIQWQGKEGPHLPHTVYNVSIDMTQGHILVLEPILHCRPRITAQQ